MAQENLRITITADNKQALAAMSQTVNSLDNVSSAAGATGGKVVKMGKDFTGISRVIQDLPYGFNAIANNLTNILPAAGALGLGISALVAGLQFAQLGFANWTRGLDGAKKKTEEAEKANEQFRESLAKERAQLDILFTTATNANVPMAARLKAVKDLRNEYGQYLKNYSDEDILVGKAAAAHEKLKNAILETAKARALSDAIQKDYEALIKLDEDLAKANQLKRQSDNEMVAFSKGKYTEDLQAKEKLLSEEKRIANERIKLNAEIQRKLSAIASTTPDPLKTPGGDKESKSKKGWSAIDSPLAHMLMTLKETGYQSKVQEQLKIFDQFVEKTKANTEANRAYSEIAQKNFLINSQNAELTALANTYTDAAMNSINGLVNAMINGQNVGQALGDMFKRLAADIVLAATKAAIFNLILGALTGGGSAALSAVKKGGAIAGAATKSLFGFSEGGTVSGPKSGYPVMLHGTEHIVRPDQMRSIIASAAQMGGGNSRVIVEGRISGQDIWLSQQRTSVYRGLTT